MRTFVSIVVRTRNRAPLLRGALASLTSQDYPGDDYDVIVSDDGSTDETPRVVDAFVSGSSPRVEYVRDKHKGANAARNAGIAAADGDLICLVDDDIQAPPGWLRAITGGAARHPAAGCIGGPIRTRVIGRQPRLCGKEKVEETELYLGPDDQLGPLLWSPNMAVQRWAFDSVGGFHDSHPIYGDEVEWELRFMAGGGTTVYIADAWLWHRVEDLVKTSFRRGRRRAEYAQYQGDPASIERELAGIPKALGHAVLHRCEWGVLATSGRLGVAWERFRQMVAPDRVAPRPDHPRSAPRNGFEQRPASDA